ncbi:MAG: Dabb family protein [Blautia sp.]|nr:Dabb family protein [Lachnoclostridium sp.]MCM1210810.1 Dabb family protein [Blautia sp.]
MIHHIVLWNWKEELTDAERNEAKARIRKELEAVKEQVTGVVSLSVITKGLPSGNKDIALISAFETQEALDAYQIHPAHVAAGSYIKTVTTGRTCFDYEG